PDRRFYRAPSRLWEPDAGQVRQKAHGRHLRAKGQTIRPDRVLFFYQPGMLIVITSGFQKKTQETPPGEITKAKQLRKLWMKYRNHYTGSPKEREAILKELSL